MEGERIRRMSSTGFAPVALFVYKRASHTLNTLGALSRCLGFAHTPVYVFCDGPKTSADHAAVAEVRLIVKQQRWSNLTIIERAENWGLAKSIVAGVTELCEQFGRVIVLEDDLEVSPYFLEYMNAALEKYASFEQVMQVSGYMFPVTLSANIDAICLPFITSWGWATWDRAWKYFDSDAKGYITLANDAAMRRRFDLQGAYPYFKALVQQQQGKLNSWAILWYLSVFMKHGVVVYPTHSLVRNNGFDGTGTNWKSYDTGFISELSNLPVRLLPEFPEVDSASHVIITRYLRRYNNPLFKFLRRFRVKVFCG